MRGFDNDAKILSLRLWMLFKVARTVEKKHSFIWRRVSDFEAAGPKSLFSTSLRIGGRTVVGLFTCVGHAG